MRVETGLPLAFQRVRVREREVKMCVRVCTTKLGIWLHRKAWGFAGRCCFDRLVSLLEIIYIFAHCYLRGLSSVGDAYVSDDLVQTLNNTKEKKKGEYFLPVLGFCIVSKPSEVASKPYSSFLLRSFAYLQQQHSDLLTLPVDRFLAPSADR